MITRSKNKNKTQHLFLKIFEKITYKQKLRKRPSDYLYKSFKQRCGFYPKRIISPRCNGAILLCS